MGEVAAMPRGERPLETSDCVKVRFARDLRLLREKAGSPTYRELSAKAHYSPASLSEAAGGRKLPSLPVTMAYVTACGGDPDEWEARWRKIAEELMSARVEPAASRAPYVGLTTFHQEDAALFFGRETLVADLKRRMRQHRFIGVSGKSGCGKSSLLRAGLAPALPGPVVVFTPGHHPFEECAIHLSRILGESPGALRDEFAADPRGLHLRLRQAPAEVVLIIDQFEELFTLCVNEQERKAFTEALTVATSDPASRTRVVLGIRADYDVELPTVQVGGLTTEELCRAITSPAAQAGYRVETALVARLVADAGGVLPWVSHALLQAWQRRQGAVLTLAGYEAAGGIAHALASMAEQTYRSLDPAQQEQARQIFLRLTALSDGPEITKRRIPREELTHCDREVLETLTRARLITLDQNSVEIAHEALLRHWPRLQTWLTTDRDGHRLHRHLTNAATEWTRQSHDESLLYRGSRLAAWQDRLADLFNETERAFLAASRQVVDRERLVRIRRLRWSLVTMGALVTVVSVLAGLAMLQPSG
jgi:hypothetical protein